MKSPACLHERDGAVWLSVKAQPRARRNAIVGPIGAELKVKVTAPPVDSAANEALVEFFAATLKCPHRAVTLVRGQTSPHKVFRFDGITLAHAAKTLGL